MAIAALAALAAAVAVAVVACAFAVYALAKPELGPAGAAAAVAGGFALLLALGALAAWAQARPRTTKVKPGSDDTMARLIQMARERPVIAAGALVAGSIIAMRNPAITALVVKSFFDSRKPPKT